MKRTILRFKEPISTRHFEIFYKDVPKFLTKFHIKRLERKKCWDIEIITDEEIERILDEEYYKKRDMTLKMIDNCCDMEWDFERDATQHIPHID